MTSTGPWIAVCGAGEDAGDAELTAAEEAGAAIAEAGAVLVCGGLGGIMEAACRGARSKGGLTVGLLPSTDRESANGWVEVAIPTGLGEARNALIEIALARKAGKPVVGLGSWELGDEADGIVRGESGAQAVRVALDVADLSRSRH